MHIVFTVNDPYVKYASVCIVSIIKNLNLQDKALEEASREYENGEINIHILSDGLSSETEKKLEELHKDLSSIAPFKLTLHTLSDIEFRGFPFFGSFKNYLIYYRLKIGTIFPNAKRALYLDADTLVNSDIRELYTKDLEGKVLGVVRDCNYKKHLKRGYKTIKKGGAPYRLGDFSDFYFNSGVLLFDLQKYKEENIEEKCREFLNTYKTQFPDQDALNVACANCVKELPYIYNCFIPKSVYLLFNSTTQDKDFYLSYKEYQEALKNAKVIHLGAKPWITPYKWGLLNENFELVEYPYRAAWWEYAKETKPFWEELGKIKEDIDNLSTEAIKRYVFLEKRNRELAKKPKWYVKSREFLRHPHKVVGRKIKALFEE